jgi:ribosomal protein L7Ae-like RNA K-turn-binding protein
MNIRQIQNLVRTEPKVCGVRQVKQMLLTPQNLRCVILAGDADPPLQEGVRGACKAAGIGVIDFPRRSELGMLCGLDVPCAVVGICNR